VGDADARKLAYAQFAIMIWILHDCDYHDQITIDYQLLWSYTISARLLHVPCSQRSVSLLGVTTSELRICDSSAVVSSWECYTAPDVANHAIWTPSSAQAKLFAVRFRLPSFQPAQPSPTGPATHRHISADSDPGPSTRWECDLFLERLTCRIRSST
jgi:hypothetical protein